ETLESTDLMVILKTHKYGRLANVNKYELVEDSDDFWCMPFSGGSELVARKLQSSLIQSGPDVIMCLEVEVYGRSSDEDPHGEAHVALPDIRPFKAVNQKLYDVSQLMNGTVRRNALVMMEMVASKANLILSDAFGCRSTSLLLNQCLLRDWHILNSHPIERKVIITGPGGGFRLNIHLDSISCVSGDLDLF
ncbi:hypothetical protein BGZ92_005319, partial [Podila epicladia]